MQQFDFFIIIHNIFKHQHKNLLLMERLLTRESNRNPQAMCTGSFINFGCLGIIFCQLSECIEL